ncbi:7,8-didemethyl-8-hydroxy-5-deazariboflavin synthase subunit CofG [Methanoplanus sp. FWC-SCC4]|uniref:7,8-didemethyl-8-hydroxy-5-deazariboflavin synthase n=1 Tax=Methanochimaera problematica TaxID=2609417 RepID=A0AA97I4N4_9EURY|nr:7,8-didemethyl-8-hydroxy-5-deazariboflavin synthase subunit CofG [Methanoplanus sp. FWC-SCC4]WOF16546.1 7,8-didemethyl-8-hydroxy-5-deazariboflavin synthase subunit CofG [Methanoplanus sp. FWC-SCC4]
MQPGIITYSRNVFLPLTNVCHNRCSYCIFKTPVKDGCVMPKADVLSTLDLGVKSGCTEALFTFGERPGLEDGFLEYIRRYGYETILEYCYDMSLSAIEMGILPHTNAGILDYNELEWLGDVNASMGLMLETTADIPAHKNSPGKKPEVRIGMMEDAGKLKIPFTTGLLLGIGETPSDRTESLEVIESLHKRYGHIQEVIIQNFCPKEGTSMEKWPVPAKEEICDTINLAREILPDDISIQIPPNLSDASELIECGVNDLGGVSPVTIDYVNPEHPWPEIENLKNIIGKRRLEERLCIYQKYIDKGWYPERLSGLIDKLNKDIQHRSYK